MLVNNLKFQPAINKLKFISLWVILLISLTACQPPQISIGQIASSKIGKTVYLTGKVVHLAPLVGNAAYQIEDATGKIWVITPQSPPQLGQVITLKGKITYHNLSVAEQDLGEFYIVELEQPTTNN